MRSGTGAGQDRERSRAEDNEAMSSDERGGSVKRPRLLQRAQVRPGPLRDLKDLLYKAYLAAEAPTLEEIAADTADRHDLAGAPRRDTVRRCISSPELPASQPDTVAVAVVLARRAGWDESDLAVRIRELWVKALMTEPMGLPIGTFTDPFALEVHRSIEVAPIHAGSELPALPRYVARAHDEQLRTVIRWATEGRSAMAVLVGGSSSGKTRACWELVQALPAEWRLWHPFDPGRSEAALEGMDQVGPRTVVWLNETQHYLLTPATGLGERLAAKLRTLLQDTDRGPVLILGTVWPEYWAALTSPPHDGEADPHTQARALLTSVSTVVDVPDVFTGPDLDALSAAADRDPRLAQAVERAEQGQITQYLAGGPALIERYQTGAPAAKALIEAAMDALRLGHGPSLPHDLLAAAAEGYLTDTQWDQLPDNWLDQAIVYTTQSLRGARGPLTRIRPRRSQPPRSQPHYRLADFLEQHARQTRRTTPVPTALWNALIDHATPTFRTSLAQAADNRGLLRIAARLDTSAAAAGDTSALVRVARRLDEAGRSDEARNWYLRAVEAGDPDALREAADRLEGTGWTEETLAGLRPFGDAGDARAVWRAAERLDQAGRREEALICYQRAADAGHPGGVVRVARLLGRLGRFDEAALWYQRAAEAGEPGAVVRLAWVLEQAGRFDEALPWYQRAAQAGDLGALGQVIGPDQARHAQEALIWMRSRADAGDSEALAEAAWLLKQAGRLEEALAWYQRAADAGHPGALREAAELLEQVGRADEGTRLRQFGWEPDGRIAERWEVLLPQAGSVGGKYP
ncbi:tetratricopeptide (TPR) repeat protein [Kitasatospora sp. GAS1066B]